MGRGWKYTLSGGGGCLPQPPSKHPKSLWKTKFFFCFSDRSYRNRKSHEIWGHLDAILRVLELIFGRGVLNTPPSVIGLILVLLYILYLKLSEWIIFNPSLFIVKECYKRCDWFEKVRFQTLFWWLSIREKNPEK